MEKNPYAILALGGYGRQEQCLHSDIDVLLLFKKKIPDEAVALVQEIFYPLWDVGLEVSYATRSLKECLSLASHDFEVLTSLVDARFLCGISTLYSGLMEGMRGKISRKKAKEFTHWLRERNQGRHTRFGDSKVKVVCETTTPCSGWAGPNTRSKSRGIWSTMANFLTMST
jgi:[protein-PII] uridylyltransferase